MENTNIILANNLKQIRAERGFSQEMLAEKAGLHRTYISLIERGKKNVTLKNIYALATALKCEPQALVKSPASVEVKPEGRTVSYQSKELALLKEIFNMACQSLVEAILKDMVDHKLNVSEISRLRKVLERVEQNRPS